MSWLTDYIEYTKHTEAPTQLHLLAGISAISSVLKRQVWIDMVTFKWFPNLYIVLVAKPGIVSKSTTLGIAADLVRGVDGINLGPDSATWQAICEYLGSHGESFEYDGTQFPQSSLCFFSSEYGSLMDLYNQEMVNFFIDLWDGKDTYNKITKTSGTDMIEGPVINLIAGTTPAWLSLNMSNIAAAGGLTSRTLFAYAEGKEKFVAYPDETISKPIQVRAKERDALIAQLNAMNHLRGPLNLTPEARAFGRTWYEHLWTEQAAISDQSWYEGYIARAQTQLHKLGICFAISDGRMDITEEDLILSDSLLTDLGKNYSRVFATTGKSPSAIAADKLLAYVTNYKKCTYTAVLQYIRSDFPDFRNFEQVVKTLLQSGQIKMIKENNQVCFIPGDTQ